MLQVRVYKNLKGLDAIENNIRRRADTALRDIADDIVADIKESIDTPYPPASRWGNPPHRRTGDLQRSISYKQYRDPKGKFGAGYIIKAEVPYAEYLESPAVLWRPFFEPALLRAWTRIVYYMITRGVGRP